jgi:hypothetical protein
MPTAEYEEKVFEEDQQYEDDKRLFAQFFTEAVEDKFASKEAGRPIFREIPCIRIMTPGSRDVTVQKANETYKRRFPKQWARYEKQLEQVQDGTPLEQVPWLTVGVIAELKAVNCHTIEHLAGMGDAQMSKMMGMIGFKQKAQAWLQVAKEAVPFTQMRAELEERDNQIQVLTQQNKEMMAAIAKLQKKE